MENKTGSSVLLAVSWAAVLLMVSFSFAVDARSAFLDWLPDAIRLVLFSDDTSEHIVAVSFGGCSRLIVVPVRMTSGPCNGIVHLALAMVCL